MTRPGLGTILVETGYVLERAPDTVRGPDVSFVSTTRLPPDRIPEQFIPGAPDLAVEILSPGDRGTAGGARLIIFFLVSSPRPTRCCWDMPGAPRP